jgi:hypothetical protein
MSHDRQSQTQYLQQFTDALSGRPPTDHHRRLARQIRRRGICQERCPAVFALGRHQGRKAPG